MSFNEHLARCRATAVEMYLAGETPRRIGAALEYNEQYVRVILHQCGAMTAVAKNGAGA